MYRPRTKRNYDLFEVASALQKSIRRGDVATAGYFAIELFESGYDNYAWKRLLTVSAEDVRDFVTQEIKSLHDSFLFVNKGSKQKKGRVFIAKAVIVLCQAVKCRDSDVLNNYVYDKHMMIDEEDLEDILSDIRRDMKEIPDYAYDVHTMKGKQKGKTKKDFFLEEMEALSPRQPGLFDHLVKA
jgi:replication-associated recombination protein RarA